MSNPNLLSMADIARLAGQSRSTVGNWKARESDFPVEQARGPRGPLYDRRAVIDWLTEKGRLAEPPTRQGEVFRLLDIARLDLPEEVALRFIHDLVALRLAVGAGEWERWMAPGARDFAGLVDAAKGATVVVEVWEVIEEERIRTPTFQRVIDGLAAIEDDVLTTDQAELSIQVLQAEGRLNPGSTTPLTLGSLMAELVGRGQSTYDPACGTGLLLYLATTNSRDGDSEPPASIFGQDVNPQAVQVSKHFLGTISGKQKIEVGSVFTDDRFPSLQADRIITHPPFTRLDLDDHLDPDDPRWVYGEPGNGDSSVAWVQHCLYHLAEGGRAVILLPHRVLFDRSKSGRAMQNIVKAGYLDAVIALPSRLLPDTPIPLVILVFTKGRARVDGKPAPTLMVDIEDAPTLGGRRERSLPPELIERIGAIYGAWSAGTAPESADAAVAQYDQIAEHKFDLTPRHYIVQPNIAVDVPDLLRQAEEIRGLVGLAMNRASLADDNLRELLRGVQR